MNRNTELLLAMRSVARRFDRIQGEIGAAFGLTQIEAMSTSIPFASSSVRAISWLSG